MENSSEKGSSLSSSSSSSTAYSSIAVELFGPKEPSSASRSSASIFGSVFGPPPVAGSHRGGTRGSWGRHSCENQAAMTRNANPAAGYSKEMNPYYHQKTIEPCHYSSSIYYGGQDVYPAAPEPKIKRDEQEDDSHLNGASRGNWWQGSLYY